MADLERRLRALERGRSADTYDVAGNLVVGDDAVAGQGLARPYVPLPLLPASTAMEVTTTTAGFVDLWVGVIYKQHAAVLAYPLVRPSDGTTAGEVRLVDITAGTVVMAGPVVIAAGSGPAYRLLQGPLGGAHLEARTISVQARRTAGAGTIGARISCCYGTPA